jgi:hypothetical protein
VITFLVEPGARFDVFTNPTNMLPNGTRRKDLDITLATIAVLIWNYRVRARAVRAHRS